MVYSRKSLNIRKILLESSESDTLLFEKLFVNKYTLREGNLRKCISKKYFFRYRFEGKKSKLDKPCFEFRETIEQRVKPFVHSKSLE
jgi:hypothetical protein